MGRLFSKRSRYRVYTQSHLVIGRVSTKRAPQHGLPLVSVAMVQLPRSTTGLAVEPTNPQLIPRRDVDCIVSENVVTLRAVRFLLQWLSFVRRILTTRWTLPRSHRSTRPVGV